MDTSPTTTKHIKAPDQASSDRSCQRLDLETLRSDHSNTPLWHIPLRDTRTPVAARQRVRLERGGDITAYRTVGGGGRRNGGRERRGARGGGTRGEDVCRKSWEGHGMTDQISHNFVFTNTLQTNKKQRPERQVHELLHGQHRPQV